MDKFGLAVGVLGLLWTIYGVWSSSRLKKALLTEKAMIKDKVLDVKALLLKHKNILLSDRQTQNNQTLNTIHIRIEDIEASLDVLDRFAQQLEKTR